MCTQTGAQKCLPHGAQDAMTSAQRTGMRRQAVKFLSISGAGCSVVHDQLLDLIRRSKAQDLREVGWSCSARATLVSPAARSHTIEVEKTGNVSSDRCRLQFIKSCCCNSTETFLGTCGVRAAAAAACTASQPPETLSDPPHVRDPGPLASSVRKHGTAVPAASLKFHSVRRSGTRRCSRPVRT